MQSETLESAILHILDEQGKAHKFNLIGRQFQPGSLERRLKVKFDMKQREEASAAFERLRRNGYIQPTYSDLADPENWITITDAGMAFLKTGLRDNIDQRLAGIGQHLIELRRGMHDAANRTSPDASRHAVNAARELVDQVIKEGAPLDCKTRKQRIKHFLQSTRSVIQISESDLDVIEACCSLIAAEHDKAIALSHSRTSISSTDARLVVDAAERALQLLLNIEKA